MIEEFTRLYREAAQLGLPGGMALFIYALYRRWIMWGSDCKEDKEELKKQRDEYKVIADKRTSEMEDRLTRLEPADRR